MRQVIVHDKLVLAPDRLKQALVVAGFAVENVVACRGTDTCVHVWLADSEAKNPTSVVLAYHDPYVLELTTSGDVPADGSSKCTVTIRKQDPHTKQPVSGNEQLRVMPSQMIGVTPHPVSLSGGVAVVQIGPSTMPGMVSIMVEDVGKTMTPGRTTVSFT